MAGYFCIFAAVCVATCTALPADQRIYQEHATLQLQQINPLDYYLDNPGVHNYYNQAQQKQVNSASAASGAPARLETLEPDSEVELIPGAQPPQQPPQTPVAPHIPGLLPGQRVFIVHMPIPGYRPGTIGGYQPVYVVGAGPQGNPGYPGNGYQNAVVINHPGQVASPGAYPQQGVILTSQGTPGYVLGAPLTLNRPFGLAYQEPVYQTLPASQGPDAAKGAIRLSQLVGLQAQPEQNINSPRLVADDKPQQITEIKGAEEPKRRPNSHKNNGKAQ
ncbi:hypothetical protein K1T71_004739 [Dendrolimus kikuchii]|uniref:Uncharacterized protein n=1 Tax=Dendrolimus kikuchii TaxID=765133 RepID=A0ACC1D987_9NEOP|nr:hypothetical protein K1T71_004739 [Dendrolimus kikuchii]